MPHFKIPPIPSSEITSKSLFQSRRSFLRQAGVLAAGAFLAGCQSDPQTPEPTHPTPTLATEPTAGSFMDEFGNHTTPLTDITRFNNYYEFTTNKRSVYSVASDFPMSPWEIAVGGLVANPKTYALEDLLSRFDQEERIYRLRCVEAWSMVIPWHGFPLASLLKEVEPLPEAKFVRFETAYDEAHMPGLESNSYPWPYVEGLRLDEALHGLTILATGIFDDPLPPQNGGPIRLVVPWKYGFKSSKSIVKIDLTDFQPRTFWASLSPDEYGFYANVNPNVDHPRWSQKNEAVVGGVSKPTLMFNGYEEHVAGLYAGMDLSREY